MSRASDGAPDDAADSARRSTPGSRFYVHTFGCRCNQADSAAIREDLSRAALTEVDAPAQADLLVINSCTVTHRTDRQVRQLARRLHRDHPAARLVVTGCYAEREPASLAAIPGVDLVVGTADRERLAAILAEKPRAGDSTRGVIVRSPVDAARDCLVAPMTRTGGKTRPLLKIQDGCDAVCSYCVIPAVRGPARSARPADVLDEARRLIAAGHREIVVTGVHLGTYGARLPEPVDLPQLLRRVLELPGLGRLRMSSIEPMRFSRALVDLVREFPAFARHFHVPLQSGSDPILRRMRRPYTTARFRALLELIADELPGVGLGTDVIVGFPGETDADFEATLECVRRSPLTYVHVFSFSPREGTPAWHLPHALPEAVIQARAVAVRELSADKNLQFRRRFLGCELPALTLAAEEGMGERAALTDNFIHVRTPRTAAGPNRLVPLRIERVERDATFGALLALA